MKDRRKCPDKTVKEREFALLNNSFDLIFYFFNYLFQNYLKKITFAVVNFLS
jgi:hypothetical protein